MHSTKSYNNIANCDMTTLPTSIYANRIDEKGNSTLWDVHRVHDRLQSEGHDVSLRTVERLLEQSELLPEAIKLAQVTDEAGNSLNTLVRDNLDQEAKRKRHPSLVVQLKPHIQAGHVFMANDGRQGRKWYYGKSNDVQTDLFGFLDALSGEFDRPMLIWPHGEVVNTFKGLVEKADTQELTLPSGGNVTVALTAYPTSRNTQLSVVHISKKEKPAMHLTHLDRLEAESIHIIREVIAETENPVMLYSIGKDSSVMLRLAQKAFYPSVPPFPLMHIDTRWKFQAMYEFRDRIAEETGMDLIVHINPEGVEKDINPFDHGSALHTDVMKTQGLIQALDKYGFDAAFGGARRDEEKSRAKERVFSFRNNAHRWDPKNQRPELWNLYNGKKAPGESIRIFPLSNWTELDIWQYIYKEEIPIVPLYFAAERPVIERDGMLMLVDDNRLKLFPGEQIRTKRVRFRTLGCYPLTGAIESDADSLPKILLELLEARTSERQGRAIDTDSTGSMEKKKQEGYF